MKVVLKMKPITLQCYTAHLAQVQTRNLQVQVFIEIVKSPKIISGNQNEIIINERKWKLVDLNK